MVADSSLQDYLAQFGSLRAMDYAAAIDRFPEVRSAEIDALLPPQLRQQGVRRFLDCPSGTGVAGILASHVFPEAESLAVDPTLMALELPPTATHTRLHAIADSSCDLVLSLAGVHHLSDRGPLLAEFCRVLRPGGYLSIADVEAGTAPARWLRRYVPGHEDARFLDPSFCSELDEAGLRTQESCVRVVPWVFDESVAVVPFVSGLFSLRICNSEIHHALNACGWNGRTSIDWQLRYTIARKP